MPKEHRPTRTDGTISHFKLGEAEGYIITGCYPDGRLCEIFLKVAKQGSTIGGLVDSLAITASHALQNGTPLGDLLRGMSGILFEPNGQTDDPEVPYASSITDYVAKRLAMDFLPEDDPDRARIMSHRTTIVNQKAGL